MLEVKDPLNPLKDISHLARCLRDRGIDHQADESSKLSGSALDPPVPSLTEQIAYEPRSICHSPSGTRFAVGTKAGSVYVAALGPAVRGQGEEWSWHRIRPHAQESHGETPCTDLETLVESRRKKVEEGRRREDQATRSDAPLVDEEFRAARVVSFLGERHLIVGSGAGNLQIFRLPERARAWDNEIRNLEVRWSQPAAAKLETAPEINRPDAKASDLQPKSWMVKFKTWISLADEIPDIPAGQSVPVGIGLTTAYRVASDEALHPAHVLFARRQTRSDGVEFSLKSMDYRRLFDEETSSRTTKTATRNGKKCVGHLVDGITLGKLRLDGPEGQVLLLFSGGFLIPMRTRARNTDGESPSLLPTGPTLELGRSGCTHVRCSRFGVGVLSRGKATAILGKALEEALDTGSSKPEAKERKDVSLAGVVRWARLTESRSIQLIGPVRGKTPSIDEPLWLVSLRSDGRFSWVGWSLPETTGGESKRLIPRINTEATRCGLGRSSTIAFAIAEHVVESGKITKCHLAWGDRGHSFGVAAFVDTTVVKSRLVHLLEKNDPPGSQRESDRTPEGSQSPRTTRGREAALTALRAKISICRGLSLDPAEHILGTTDQSPNLERWGLREPDPKDREIPDWTRDFSSEDLDELCRFLKIAVLRRLRELPNAGEPGKDSNALPDVIEVFQIWSLRILRRATELQPSPMPGLARMLREASLLCSRYHRAFLMNASIFKKWFLEGHTYQEKELNFLELVEWNLTGGRDLDALVYSSKLLRRRLDSYSESNISTPWPNASVVALATCDGLTVQSHHDGRLTLCDDEGRSVPFLTMEIPESNQKPPEMTLVPKESGISLEPGNAEEFRRDHLHGPHARDIGFARVDPLERDGETDGDALYALILVLKAHEKFDGKPVLFTMLLRRENDAMRIVDLHTSYLTTARGAEGLEVYSLDMTTPWPGDSNGWSRLVLFGTRARQQISGSPNPRLCSFAARVVTVKRDAVDVTNVELREVTPEPGEAREDDDELLWVPQDRSLASSAAQYDPARSLAVEVRGEDRLVIWAGHHHGDVYWYQCRFEIGEGRGEGSPTEHGLTILASENCRSRGLLPAASPVRSLDLQPEPKDDSRLLAVGTEDGIVAVTSVRPDTIGHAARPGDENSQTESPSIPEGVTLVHTSMESPVVYLGFFREEFDPPRGKAGDRQLIAVSEAGEIRIFDLDLGRPRPLPPDSDAEPSSVLINCRRWVSGNLLDRCRIDHRIISVAPEGQEPGDKVSRVHRSLLGYKSTKPLLHLAFGCADGQVRLFVLSVPRESERRRLLYRTCQKLLFDPKRFPIGDAVPENTPIPPATECLSNYYGFAGAMGRNWILRWLRVIDATGIELPRLSLRVECDILWKEYDSRSEESTGRNEDLDHLQRDLRFLSDEVHRRRPFSSDAIKIIWDVSGKEANQRLAKAFFEHDPGDLAWKLKAYWKINDTLESFTNRWRSSSVEETPLALTYSFQSIFDWPDVYLLAGRFRCLEWSSDAAKIKTEEREELETVHADLTQFLLRQLIFPRIFHADPAVQLDAMRCINLAILQAVDRIYRESSLDERPEIRMPDSLGFCRRKRDEERPQNQAVETRSPSRMDFLDLMSAVGSMARRCQSQMKSGSPVFSEVARFFALCLHLAPKSSFVTGVIVSEYGLFEADVDPVYFRDRLSTSLPDAPREFANRIREAAELINVQLRREFELPASSSQTDATSEEQRDRALAAGNALKRFQAYLNGANLDKKDHPDLFPDGEAGKETDGKKGNEEDAEAVECSTIDDVVIWKEREMVRKAVEELKKQRSTHDPPEPIQKLKAEVDQKKITAFRHSAPCILRLAECHLELWSQMDPPSGESSEEPKPIREARDFIRRENLFEPQRTTYLRIVKEWEKAQAIILLNTLDGFNRHVYQSEAAELNAALRALVLQIAPLSYVERRAHRGSLRALMAAQISNDPILGNLYDRATRLIDQSNISSILNQASLVRLQKGKETPFPLGDELTGLELREMIEEICRREGMSAEELGRSIGVGSTWRGGRTIFNAMLTELIRNIKQHGSEDSGHAKVYYSISLGKSTRNGLFLRGTKTITLDLEADSKIHEASGELMQRFGPSRIRRINRRHRGYGLSMVHQLADIQEVLVVPLLVPRSGADDAYATETVPGKETGEPQESAQDTGMPNGGSQGDEGTMTSLLWRFSDEGSRDARRISTELLRKIWNTEDDSAPTRGALGILLLKKDTAEGLYRG